MRTHSQHLHISIVWCLRDPGTDAIGKDYGKRTSPGKESLQTLHVIYCSHCPDKVPEIDILIKEEFFFCLVVSEGFLQDCSSLFGKTIMEGGVCCYRESYSLHGIRK